MSMDLPSAQHPEAVLDALCARGTGIAMFKYPFSADYLPARPTQELVAAFVVVDAENAFGLVTDNVQCARNWAATHTLSLATLGSLAEAVRAPFFDLAGPIALAPIRIEKPWGQEIWYTGIEARGQSQVSDGTHTAPLPWLISLAPQRLLASSGAPINLLKILDPLPDATYGDLYFELHEAKQEVYVVAHVDRGAWPDGVGAIRYGFNAELRAQYPIDDDFKAAYLAAVLAYERVRRELDRLIDGKRIAAGLALTEPLAADTLRQWQQSLPPELVRLEQSLRAEMNHFTALRPLRVGDVVKVPCLTPHALQHGVRTVEFQTPVYERKILSFAQKVLTQDHWDTAAAIDIMTLDAPAGDDFEELGAGDGWRLELIVSFADFRVQRLSLCATHRWQLPCTGNYGLVMTVVGRVRCGEHSLGAESAVLAPAGRHPLTIVNDGAITAVVLIAEPISTH